MATSSVPRVEAEPQARISAWCGCGQFKRQRTEDMDDVETAVIETLDQMQEHQELTGHGMEMAVTLPAVRRQDG